MLPPQPACSHAHPTRILTVPTRPALAVNLHVFPAKAQPIVYLAKLGFTLIAGPACLYALLQLIAMQPFFAFLAQASARPVRPNTTA